MKLFHYFRNERILEKKSLLKTVSNTNSKNIKLYKNGNEKGLHNFSFNRVLFDSGEEEKTTRIMTHGPRFSRNIDCKSN